MTFSDLKSQAKESLNKHFGYYLLLFLPIFIIQIATAVLTRFDEADLDYSNPDFSGYWPASILGWVSSLLMVGIMFIMIDHGRQLRDYEQPVTRSFNIVSRGDYFIGTFGLGILMFVYTFLWSLLLVVPGIVKSFSYSQAIYIYRDHLDQGTKVSFNQAITESRQMMDGHKWEMFLLGLSFIGWNLLCILVIPIIWVMPYEQQTFANYYVALSAPSKDDKEDDLMSIAK